MTSQEAQENIELVAQLLGTTKAELGEIDKQVIGESSSLRTAGFDPHSILKNSVGSLSDDAVTPSPGNPQPAPPSDFPPPPPVTPVQGHVSPAPAPAMDPGVLNIVLSQIDQINKQLKVLTDKVNTLTTLDEHLVKSVDRGLKNKIRQITIKLDDSGN